MIMDKYLDNPIYLRLSHNTSDGTYIDCFAVFWLQNFIEDNGL